MLPAGVPVPASTDCSPDADAATDCSADAGTDSATDCASEHWTELDLLFETTTSPDVSAMTPRTPPPLSWKAVPTVTFTSSVPVPDRPPMSTDAKFDSTSAI